MDKNRMAEEIIKLDGGEALAATKYIVKKIAENYSSEYDEVWWYLMESYLRNSVHGGLT